MDMNLDEIKEVFISECSEILQKMETTLLGLEGGADPTDDEINDLFRSIHTIKGSAGIFGSDSIVKFTHVVESVLDKVRDKALPFKKELVGLMIDCRDHITDLVECAANNLPLESNSLKTQDRLLIALEDYLGGKVAPVPTDIPEQEAPPSQEQTISPLPESYAEMENESVEGEAYWHISLRFGIDTFRNGLDPFAIFNYLNKVGEIKSLMTLTYRVPFPVELDPENCYLGFEFLYSCDKDYEFVKDAFEFVQYDCDIVILPAQRKVEDWFGYFEKRPEPLLKLTRILLHLKSITPQTLKNIFEFNRQKKGRKKKASPPIKNETQPLDSSIDFEPDSPVEKKVEKVESPSPSKEPSSTPSSPKEEPEAKVLAAPNSESKTQGQPKKENPNRENRTIRIDSAKLDLLVNLVGELVISGANLTQLSSKRKDTELIESTSHLNHLVSEIRDSALNLRMVQIGETFNRFHRVVRDISIELGKDVQLVISGGETELDKTVVEKINDPLMHIIRNALDHGIEPTQERIDNGKPARGKLSLHAFHEAGNIVIEVSDDGKGLNKEKIYNKALEKGLISQERQLTDQEVMRLIFKPGFSTAEKVTNLSGRGVGLDVVERNIESLRGSVTIFSEPNQGTSMQIRLPLTLAIIDGFLFKVSHYYYVVPLYQVVECVEYNHEVTSKDGKNFINLRGHILPFIPLADIFSHEPLKEKIRQNILVIQYMGKQVGILVDSLHGEFQTVIKPLGKIFQHLKGISGTTVLGSGEVALILDVPLLFEKVINAEHLKFSSSHLTKK
ncbi:MAG: chemotaxis protein CheA [Leptospiraceae bacterium]|nr:chemotaxis protein CheA [Leptospiraceae bacterium]MCP5512097.1 chemotaxis protein CheA [Leptospiraceae bacterium]